MVNTQRIATNLAYIVGILFIIGAIVALAVDLATEPHTITYGTITLAIVLVIVGIVIIVIVAYFLDQKKP